MQQPRFLFWLEISSIAFEKCTDAFLYAPSRCRHYGGAVRQGGTISLHCRRNNHGRYVYVMLRGRNYLTLCEVEVYSQGGRIIKSPDVPKITLPVICTFDSSQLIADLMIAFQLKQ